MSNTQVRGPQAPGVPPQASGVTVPSAFKARRRSPWMATLSIALIAVCGTGFGLANASAGDRVTVLTVTGEVQAGQTITEQDLGTAKVAVDSAVKPVKAEQRESVVGKRAAVGLKPGSLLSSSQVTTTSLVAEGEQVVPVGLKAALVPASELAPGQTVEVVKVAKDEAGAATSGKSQSAPTQESVKGRVVKVGSADQGSGTSVVDVAVKSADGPQVLSWSANETAALALDTGGA